MGTTSSFFGGSSSSAAAPVYTSFDARKKLTHKATTTSISGNNGYLPSNVFVCPVNDTHFIVHYVNTNEQQAYARMFELNTSTFAVSPIAPSSWLSIGSSSSTGDMDGIQAGNGNNTAYLGYRISSSNRIIKVVWDGSTGLSKSTAVDTTGSATPWNNVSCTIDGTLIGQVYNQSAIGYHCSTSPTGSNTSSYNTISIDGSAAKGGSVGMDNGIFSIGLVSSASPRLLRMYKGNNMSWNITDADIKHNSTYCYNPNNLKIARSGNRVVFVLVNTSQTSQFGATSMEGYCGESEPDGAVYHRVQTQTGSVNAGYMEQNYRSKPNQQVNFGSFNRQYDGTYLDRGFIADFGEDTRFSVSYPYQYLFRMGTSGTFSETGRQCRIGNYIIQGHRLGSSGNYTMEFDVWEIK